MGRGGDRDRTGRLAFFLCRRRGPRSARLTAPRRIAIVGAGVGGLAAAHRLLELSRERALPIELVVLEASDRAGGVVGTDSFEGALLERGADTLVTHKPAAIELCRRLGLADRLVSSPTGAVDILREGGLHPAPSGFAVLAPTRTLPLLRSPLISWRSKVRALAEPFLRRKDSNKGEESVAAFVRRRLGEELLARIVEPMAGAIQMGDVEKLSLEACFPRFATLERDGGSVTRGLRRAARARGEGAQASLGPVATLAGGMGAMVEALVARLPAGTLRLQAAVRRLRREGSAFFLDLESRETLAAEAVVIATPAPPAAALLRELDPTLAAGLSSLESATAITVHLAWPAAAVARPPESLGFFVPRTAGTDLVAATFLSVKYPERVPEGQVVVRLFFGGALHPESADRSDSELVELGYRLLEPLLGLGESTLWSHVVRHRDAMPQPAVGHLARVAAIGRRLADHSGLELAGGPLGAYGLPDTIAAAEAAAERLVQGVL